MILFYKCILLSQPCLLGKSSQAARHHCLQVLTFYQVVLYFFFTFLKASQIVPTCDSSVKSLLYKPCKPYKVWTSQLQLISIKPALLDFPAWLCFIIFYIIFTCVSGKMQLVSRCIQICLGCFQKENLQFTEKKHSISLPVHKK